ncbi:MAG: aspartate-semialdehyde dehydrogenase [Ruminococcaceae bacterium]|nr:aspartate-semialdehyde dehydrogenase [Oscillospiraceae bacterium]
MEKYSVGIIGATGMVGQRFALLLAEHPWFDVKVMAASARSAGKTYKEAVGKRWLLADPMPAKFENMIVMDATADMKTIAGAVDFVFCAVDMPKAEIKALEEAYASLGCPVMSNNSANRFTPDVPMIIPEINADHAEVIKYQQKRLGTDKGFIAVKSNCSLQSYVPAIHPLLPLGVERALACTYQAISGAGKNFNTWPEMIDNVIPYIGGEEEKSEQEPTKIWGVLEDGVIKPRNTVPITAQCIRVPVSDGHMAAVFVKLENNPGMDEIKRLWAEFAGEPQKLGLPSAPAQYIHYFEEDNRPQTNMDRMLEKGMAVSVGRLREDSQYTIKFVCLSHNTLRGAAGGGVLMAELLCAKGYIKRS